MKTLVLAAGLAATMISPALAGEGADIATTALYAGTHQEGLTLLAELGETGDAEALFGEGMLHFVSGVEGYMQAMYRHGLSAPDMGGLAAMLDMPMDMAEAEPETRPIEPLDYDGYLQILDDLVVALDAARDSFLAAADAGEFVVPLDIFSIRIDGDGDGVADDTETIRALLFDAIQSTADTLGEDPSDAEDLPDEFMIGFDNADAYWLAGYGQVFAAQTDLFLAHDFSDLSAVFFHRMFPMAGFPMQDYANGSSLNLMDPQSEAFIADLIAAVHSFNFEVVDAERLAGVRQRLLSITAYSRASWDAILAETDDNHELVPSPSQTPFTSKPVTDEMISSWVRMLDTLDKILEGDLLLPHWRFEQGFDLKAYFETAERTDLVLILSGYGALPFLADGPIVSAKHFANVMRTFGDDFIGYAIWFN